MRQTLQLLLEDRTYLHLLTPTYACLQVRQTLQLLLEDRTELAKLKEIAGGLDCLEAIEFCIEVREYKMLFAAADLQDGCKRIWARYLDDKADRIVNLPSAVHKSLKKHIVDEGCASVSASTFDRANKEVLQILVDNVYPVWLKQSSSSSENTSGESSAKLPPPQSSGGCCTVL